MALRLIARFAILACAVAVLSARPSVSEDGRRDGNLWQTVPTVELKVFYIGGFLDGIVLGSQFTMWKSLKTNNGCLAESYNSIGEYSRRYLANVTAKQIVDGLDRLYADYRNRKILVYDGVWLAL